MNITAIQDAVRRAGVDGWLFFDHHQRDLLAYRILGLPTDLHATRRWYYLIPANGEPRKLLSRIEPHSLDRVPGIEFHYSSWREQTERLGAILSGTHRIAMQYSPECAVPYVSMVDGGTIELVKSQGVDIVSSADLVAEFEAVLTSEQLETHLEAVKRVEWVRCEAFELISERLKSHSQVTEFEVQQFILRRFAGTGLITDHGPIVATNEHAADPHFEPSAEHDRCMRAGDLVLVDMWAKLERPDAVFADITWIGFCGQVVPGPIQQVFEVVRDARQAGCKFVVDSAAGHRGMSGFEVDDAARILIAEAGFADSFMHRTGHSIGTDVHGTGANMDNFESHDTRVLLPNTCFSIEPGVYLKDFGIRSEVDVILLPGRALVTTEEQRQIQLL